MLDKAQTRSKKSFGFNIRKHSSNVVCLKQNLVQQSSEERSVVEHTRKHVADRDATVSTRITSNLSSHKNSIDEATARFRRPEHSRSTMREIKEVSLLMGRTDSQPDALLHRGLFNYKSVLGKGGFGKVWRVELKKNQCQYALKEMSKALQNRRLCSIITKKSVPSVMNEKSLLSTLKHPFLVNMVASFQDRETLHLVMDLMPGGDLRHHIARRRRFSEEQTKFIAANIFLCLEYLHQNHVIHRDIKPENIVFDERGYLRVTDLGIARYMKPENSSDTSGTPGYMGKTYANAAPEVMCRQNHSYSVDFFALGVIVYELMLGKRPYHGRSRKEIRDEVLARQAQVKKTEIPDGWSIESADFVNRMIQRKPGSRLGNTSSQEIRKHPWLRNFPWDRLHSKTLTAPFVPHIERGSSIEQQLQVSSENTETKEMMQQNTVLLRKQEVQDLFSGYEQQFTDGTFE